MMHVQEPVSECVIEVVELVRQPQDPGAPRRVMNIFRYNRIDDFKKLLQEHYALARSLGYEWKTPPDKAKYNELVEGRLQLRYTDRFVTSTYELESIHHLARFLDAHGALASALGYKKKA